MPVNTIGFAALDEKSPLQRHTYTLKELGPDEVHVSVQYCGVCHTDYHEVKNEWGLETFYPMVPGHEIVGFVEATGKDVKKLKKGDRVGVGWQSNSCGSCEKCQKGNEPYCKKVVSVFNWKDLDGSITQGGFAKDCVCHERFVVKFPENLDMAASAPLLCAGITVYSPMKHFGMDRKGARVGIVGMGGLGHMAVKFAKAFGSVPIVLSRTEAKRQTARELGADEFIVTTNSEQLKQFSGSLDYILDTASGPRDLGLYLDLLKVDGVHCMVGIPPSNEKLTIDPSKLIFARRSLSGSLVGGPVMMQEMLDFCSQKKIECSVEKIDITYINEAFQRMLKGDVRYRFVVDCTKIQ